MADHDHIDALLKKSPGNQSRSKRRPKRRKIVYRVNMTVKFSLYSLKNIIKMSDRSSTWADHPFIIHEPRQMFEFFFICGRRWFFIRLFI